MGFFDKIKQSLTRTKEQFVERFEEVVKRADEPAKRSQPIDVETIDALEEALISADVGVAATEQIVQAVRAKRASGASLRGLVKEEIRSILREANPPAGERPSPACRAHRRRERHRKDHDGRQAGAPDQRLGQGAADLRGGYVPGRGGRAARDLGETRRRRHHQSPGRMPIRPPSSTTRSRRENRDTETWCSSIPPDVCTRAPI